MCFNIKISSNLRKTKKKPFFAFFCVTLKIIFKWPPIGHYRRLTPCTQLISKIMFQFFQNTCGSQRYLQKYGCQTPPKSVDPDLCPSKKLFFGLKPFFCEQPCNTKMLSFWCPVMMVTNKVGKFQKKWILGQKCSFLTQILRFFTLHL